MKNFSLLAPTRERPMQVERLLQSIIDTAKDLSNIEVLFTYDNDDSLSHQLFSELNFSKYKELTIKFFKKEHSDFLNRDCYNWLGNQAEGKYLWIIGDDVIFLVNNWDEIIYNKVESYLSDKPDKVVCAGIKDTTPKPKPSLPQFPCFPLFSRPAMEQMGFLLHPFVPTWGADYLIYLLYTGANRYLEINDRDYLHHISVHTKTAPKDNTAIQVERIFNQLKMANEHNIDLAVINVIPKQVEDLKQKIRNLGG